MKKIHNQIEIKFDRNTLILMVDNKTVQLNLSTISKKLEMASEAERNDYKVSPSGYGIHWNLLDEDLSINGLLKMEKTKVLSHNH